MPAERLVTLSGYALGAGSSAHRPVTEAVFNDFSSPRGNATALVEPMMPPGGCQGDEHSQEVDPTGQTLAQTEKVALQTTGEVH